MYAERADTALVAADGDPRDAHVLADQVADPLALVVAAGIGAAAAEQVKPSGPFGAGLGFLTKRTG